MRRPFSPNAMPKKLLVFNQSITSCLTHVQLSLIFRSDNNVPKPLSEFPYSQCNYSSQMFCLVTMSTCDSPPLPAQS